MHLVHTLQPFTLSPPISSACSSAPTTTDERRKSYIGSAIVRHKVKRGFEALLAGFHRIVSMLTDTRLLVEGRLSNGE